MKSAAKILIAGTILLILALLATYPLVFEAARAVKNLGDPVLNMWIIQWDIHKFSTGLVNFFDANAFYPYENTLAYSEHLIPQALLAWPVWIFSRDPVLAYNFNFILTFVLSGLGIFLLVEYLTDKKTAAFLSAIIFAFSPYRFGHLGHLQVLSVQWIPFTFLYWHKFMDRARLKDLGLFSLFLVLQTLSCSYYAFYLSLLYFIAFIYWAARGRLRGHKIWAFILAGAMIAIFVFPFFYPYYRLKKETNFSRPISEVEFFSAEPKNYLASPPANKLWGRLTSKNGGNEKELFPGLAALILFLVAVCQTVKLDCPRLKFKIWLNRFLDTLLLVNAAAIICLIKHGGFDFKLGGLGLSVHSPENPLYFFLLLLIARWLNSSNRMRFIAAGDTVNFYLLLALVSFILSLGPVLKIGESRLIDLPYQFLFKYVPGFQGLRVPARFGALVSFFLAVLAGCGLKRIIDWPGMKNIMAKYSLIGLFFLVSLGESVYWPISYERLPSTVPEVYLYLGGKTEDLSLVELPMPADTSRAHYEAMYMYWSIFHWKKLLNGYSGHTPLEYWSQNRLLQRFPNEESLNLLESLGIDYALVHMNKLEAAKKTAVVEGLIEFSDRMELERSFNEDLLIRIKRGG